MCGAETRSTKTGVCPCIEFPRKEPKRGRWLKALELAEEDLKDFHRVCSRHFPDGNATKDPQLNLGKRFASPKKRWTSRAKRAVKRNRLFSQGISESESSSRSVTPGSVSQKESGKAEASQSQPESPPVMVARIGEQLDTSFQVHELPTDDSISLSSASAPTVGPSSFICFKQQYLRCKCASEQNTPFKDRVFRSREQIILKRQESGCTVSSRVYSR